MDGKSHAECLVKKCSSRVSFLYRNRSFLNAKTRTILCSALIQPLLDYCCSSWYGLLSLKLRNKLDVIQRKMIRFIFSMHHMEHVDSSHYLNLSLLTIKDRVDFFKLCHVFKIRVGRAPSYLTHSFVPDSFTHSHATRGSCAHSFFLSHRAATVPNTFSFTAIKAWNDLPSDLKVETSEQVVKSKLKSFFLRKYWTTYIFITSLQALYFQFTQFFVTMFKGPWWKQVTPTVEAIRDLPYNVNCTCLYRNSIHYFTSHYITLQTASFSPAKLLTVVAAKCVCLKWTFSVLYDIVHCLICVLVATLSYRS